MARFARHLVVRLFLVIAGFFVISWPLISSWRPESTGGVQQHLFFFWGLAIVILYFMSRGDAVDEEAGAGPNSDSSGEV